jgi:hypothetical protein
MEVGFPFNFLSLCDLRGEAVSLYNKLKGYNMKSLLTFVFIILSGVVFAQEEIKKAEMETIFSIGDDPNATGNYILQYPKFVEVKNNGNIYIAENAYKKIKVYNSEGEFVRDIGGLGKGPGEFSDLSYVKLVNDSLIIVFDMFNGRFSTFDLRGNLKKTQKIRHDKILWPRSLLKVKDKYIILQNLDYIDEIFHVFDSSMETKLMSFCDDIHNMSKPINRAMLVYSVHLLKLNDKSFLYSPLFYGGKIYKFTKDNNDWSLTGSLTGFVKEKKAYEILDNGIKDKNKFSIKGRVGGSAITAKLNNESRGLFKLSDDRIIHFTLITVDDHRVFGFELFTPEGELIDYYELKRKKQKYNEAVDIRWKVAAIDNKDNFYIIDRTEFATVRKVKINIPE